MASIGGIAVKPQKRSRRSDAVAYSELSLRQNAAILDYCRTSMSALAGATAGIMGLTSLLGFVFYFVSAFILSVFLTIKAGSRWNTFFISRKILFVSGLFGGLFHLTREEAISAGTDEGTGKIVNGRRTYYFGHFCMEWYMFIEQE